MININTNTILWNVYQALYKIEIKNGTQGNRAIKKSKERWSLRGKHVKKNLKDQQLKQMIAHFQMFFLSFKGLQK